MTLETLDKVTSPAELNRLTRGRVKPLFVNKLFAQVDYMKYLPVNLATSHPHYDKEGNAYNMGTSIAEKGKTKYILFKVPAVSEKGM